MKLTEVYLHVTDHIGKTDYIGKLLNNNIILPFADQQGEVLVTKCNVMYCNHCQLNQCIGTRRVFDTSCHIVEIHKGQFTGHIDVSEVKKWRGSLGIV